MREVPVPARGRASGTKLANRFSEQERPEAPLSHRLFPRRFGDYILLGRLGSGGMAEVYRAKKWGEEQFQRFLAIKCLLPHLSGHEDLVELFIGEAKLAAQLNHPNIVQTYELGRHDDTLFITMELVNGHDLGRVLKRARQLDIPIPTEFTAHVIASAAEALAHAHHSLGLDGTTRELVHRDISPQNILIGFDGQVKVGDFGIARVASEETRNDETGLRGKVAYMAPEQLEGGPIDRRTDLYALGAVLYELLAGKKLVQGRSEVSVLRNSLDFELPDLSSIERLHGERWVVLLNEVLAHEPERRIQYAHRFADELRRLLVQRDELYTHRDAAQVMQLLYADEIDQLPKQRVHDADVRPDDCIDFASTTMEPPADAEATASGHRRVPARTRADDDFVYNVVSWVDEETRWRDESELDTNSWFFEEQARPEPAEPTTVARRPSIPTTAVIIPETPKEPAGPSRLFDNQLALIDALLAWPGFEDRAWMHRAAIGAACLAVGLAIVAVAHAEPNSVTVAEPLEQPEHRDTIVEVYDEVDQPPPRRLRRARRSSAHAAQQLRGKGPANAPRRATRAKKQEKHSKRAPKRRRPRR